MLNPTDLKKGTLVQFDDKPYRVVEYSQKVLGRGGSIVNVRLKNLIDGSVFAKTIKGAEKVAPADVSSKKAQYLYNDGQKWHFMDPQSFEQIDVNKELVEDVAPYLKEGDIVELQFFGERLINVEIPKNLHLTVSYTENVVKGDTTTNILKDATLETGLIVKVPAFIKTGDQIKVDTRTGQYLERKK